MSERWFPTLSANMLTVLLSARHGLRPWETLQEAVLSTMEFQAEAEKNIS